MAVEFKLVKFEISRQMCDKPYVVEQGFTLRGKLRSEGSNPSYNVALQSFSLQSWQDGQLSHYPIGFDQVTLERTLTGDSADDGRIKLTIHRRPHPEWAKAPGWNFSGTVTALVIADLASS
ncbi:hypothetical protein [Streptomyces griseocarneus]|uniref:hypothetical protein n=1 Tax=Streptomyces griseocarneus TaxID=51201 RepID=UPI00167E8D74|nr:hypothetical protein [Streptomyces griseocarneus]MBZ6474985.1 hypothetical protein [Streptomyces griseocarneus]GHG49256.1 hypothetical protein GCM10018779_08100 [Streptomyces griseocarneus]